MPRVLVAGVGNVLLQDDGFGPHLLARLQSEYEVGDNAELLDLGTPGLDFIDYLEGCDVLIIVDALSSGGRPGDILTFDRERLDDCMPNMRLSAHQPCLQETLFMAETADVCPPEVVLVGVVGQSFEVDTSLSATVEKTMPSALEVIAELLSQHRVIVRRRERPLPCTSWWAAAAKCQSA